MKTFLPTAARIAATCVICFFCFGCPCDQYVRMVVLAGHHTPDECRQAIDKVSSNKLTLICPGEEVTICWQSNGNGVTIDPGLGNFPNVGITYFKPQSSTTVTANAPGTCASAVSVPVTVVSQDTPSHWDGSWDPRCSQITFDIDPLFVSPGVYAKDITALWAPILTDANGNPVIACTTPPFLDGFQQQDVFGFKINDPSITTAFSRHIKADGHWQFVLKAACPTGDWTCNKAGSYPFDLTLTCAP